MVEVVSSLERDGRPVFRDLRWGVYVVLKAPNSYAAACLTEYGLPTDSTGQYAAMYKPFHLIGLELSISVLNAALRGESTGTAREWRGAEFARLVLLLQFDEGFCHAVELQGSKLFYGWVCQHRLSFPQWK